VEKRDNVGLIHSLIGQKKNQKIMLFFGLDYLGKETMARPCFLLNLAQDFYSAIYRPEGISLS